MRGLLREASIGLAGAVCVLAYLLPYLYLPGIWWRAIPSACALLLVGFLFLGRDTFRFFGLAMTWRALAISVALFSLLLPVMSHVLLELVVVQPLSADWRFYSRGEVHQLFQVFNDEIVLRAALLTLSLHAFAHPKTVILITALLFAVGHHVLYRVNGISIEWPAILSLFSFGTIVNCLFVHYSHIGYGLALHYAWNFYRFSTRYSYDGLPLEEGMTFNYIEGNPWVVSASFIAAVLTFAAYAYSSRRGRAPHQPPH